jgi:hypothetical protein
MLFTIGHRKSTFALAVCILLSAYVGGTASAFPSSEHRNGLRRHRPLTAGLRDDTKALVDMRLIEGMELLLDHVRNEAAENNVGKDESATEDVLTFSRALPAGNLYEIVKPWTMVARDQQEVVFNEIARLNENNISGAVVECGVWAGGSSMIMLYSQIRSGSTDRNFWLYDTYEGHVAPDVAKDGAGEYNAWKAVVDGEEKSAVVGTFLLSIDKKCVFFVCFEDCRGLRGFADGSCSSREQRASERFFLENKRDLAYRGDSLRRMLSSLVHLYGGLSPLPSLFLSSSLIRFRWVYAPLDLVRNNVRVTGYPLSHVHFVKGKVEDTLPHTVPNEPIALLRLDTDFYHSTKAELEVLYPRLISGGTLIIDDYCAYQGSRTATDEYFQSIGTSVEKLLNGRPPCPVTPFLTKP